MFQFPRIGARMTQRQRVNYAWWQTSRNRVVASPGKTAAVGEAAKQGKITPGLQWSCGDGPICQNVIPRCFYNFTKVLGFFIVSIFAKLLLRRETTQQYTDCLRLNI